MSACPSYETLVALWAGELHEVEAAAVDEHLFGCDACAAATERLAKVVGTLRETPPFVTSRPHRERLEAAGTRVAVTDVEPTLVTRVGR
jgi:anti-sigma factor RsiW